MADITNQPLMVVGDKLISPPPKLTYRQALIRWPRLFRDPNGQFKGPSPFSKESLRVETPSLYGQNQFGIAGRERDAE